ncbi:MAG: hypothetical protein H0T54_05565 [Geodermatophilaceae bacterium]|nr:hypothetical protein [Geodermatophilaceae bacterium]
MFGGIQFGLLSVIVYLLIRRWLPTGILGGFTFGVALLIVGSTFAEPLRPDNVDFAIVGPGWLSVLTFGLLVVTFGMLVAGLAGGFSRSLRPLAMPVRSNARGVIVGYWPLLLLVVIFPLGGLAIVVGLLVVLGSKLLHDAEFWRSPRLVLVGRVLLAAGTLASLPRFVNAVSEILAA